MKCWNQWLHSSVVWSVAPVSRGHGFKPRWSPDFSFQSSVCNCLNCVQTCNDHGLLKGFIIRHSTPLCRFVILLLFLPVFVVKCILETHEHLCFLRCHFCWRFWFSRFLAQSRQRNHRKCLYSHGKYVAKENFRAPVWTSAKFYCGNKTGNLAPSCPLG